MVDKIIDLKANYVSQDDKTSTEKFKVEKHLLGDWNHYHLKDCCLLPLSEIYDHHYPLWPKQILASAAQTKWKKVRAVWKEFGFSFSNILFSYSKIGLIECKFENLLWGIFSIYLSYLESNIMFEYDSF